jgi:hypothetical protein
MHVDKTRHDKAASDIYNWRTRWVSKITNHPDTDNAIVLQPSTESDLGSPSGPKNVAPSRATSRLAAGVSRLPQLTHIAPASSSKALKRSLSSF